MYIEVEYNERIERGRTKKFYNIYKYMIEFHQIVQLDVTENIQIEGKH